MSSRVLGFPIPSSLGVPLTKHSGFHQFDVYGDLLGLLAAHPIAPLVSIHHLDVVEPIFPKSPSRPAAIRRLFDAPSASTPPGSCSRLRHAEAVSWAISYLARAVCLSNLVCLPISSGWFRREIEDRCRLIKVQCYSGESTANFSIVGLAKLLEQKMDLRSFLRLLQCSNRRHPSDGEGEEEERLENYFATLLKEEDAFSLTKEQERWVVNIMLSVTLVKLGLVFYCRS